MIAFGDYELLRRIGRGGMAEVWTARKKSGGPIVALKRILPQLRGEPAMVAMFREEAKWAGRLAYERIVGLYEAGEVDGVAFLAMEYVRGRDLGKALKAQRKLLAVPPLPVALFVAREMARALAFAHALCDDSGRRLELVHRDVTPGNVLLGWDGGVKLGDFGIAKSLVDEGVRTRTGIRKGKPPYLAPERAAGLAFDHRSDLFSAGAVLFELVHGARLSELTELADAEAYVAAHAAGPAALTEILRRALARDPARRFGEAGELAAALDPLCADAGADRASLAAWLGALFPGEAARDDAAVVVVDHTRTLLPPKTRRAAVLAAVALVVAAAVAALALFLSRPARRPPIAPPEPERGTLTRPSEAPTTTTTGTETTTTTGTPTPTPPSKHPHHRRPHAKPASPDPDHPPPREFMPDPFK